MKYSATIILGLGLLCGTAFAAADAKHTRLAMILEEQGLLEQTAVTHIKEGKEFLEKNKTKEGIVTLPDGLQYKVIKAGTGAQPIDGDSVTVNYSGTFIDGTEFDSSYKRGQPTTFPVNGVIPGWTEALKLMKVGSIWELYIPSNLAYGDYGMVPLIGPNQTLIFKVELLGINQGQTPK